MIYILLGIVGYLLVGALIGAIWRWREWSAFPMAEINSHIRTSQDQTGLIMLWFPALVVNLVCFIFLWAPLLSRWLYRCLDRNAKWRRNQRDF